MTRDELIDEIIDERFRDEATLRAIIGRAVDALVSAAVAGERARLALHPLTAHGNVWCASTGSAAPGPKGTGSAIPDGAEVVVVEAGGWWRLWCGLTDQEVPERYRDRSGAKPTREGG